MSLLGNFVPKQSTLKINSADTGYSCCGHFAYQRSCRSLPTVESASSIPLGAERKYGAGGGGICPNCHRPFALPLLSAHVGFSKLAVCPFCGKWSLVRVELINKLREAEKAELESAKPENHI